MCHGCPSFRFVNETEWRTVPESEFLSELVKSLSKKDICPNCNNKIKRETTICKPQGGE